MTTTARTEPREMAELLHDAQGGGGLLKAVMLSTAKQRERYLALVEEYPAAITEWWDWDPRVVQLYVGLPMGCVIFVFGTADLFEVSA